jgi:hypothetical protein
VAGILIGIVLFIVLFNQSMGPEGALSGIALVGMTLAVTFSIERGLRTGTLSWLNWVVITAALLSYGAMAWIYFLGGWAVLGG